jgi:hypothetical protein
MKIQNTMSLLPLLLIGSCGNQSPFDEYYKDAPAFVRTENISNDINLTSKILSLSDKYGSIGGSIEIAINQTDVLTITHLTEVPQNVIVGKRRLSDFSCIQIASTLIPFDILSYTTEFKDFNSTENGSREALVAELNIADPRNGESVNLVGKSYIIEAYIENLNAASSGMISLLPIACGKIQAKVK